MSAIREGAINVIFFEISEMSEIFDRTESSEMPDSTCG
jgi:hypothetical protein